MTPAEGLAAVPGAAADVPTRTARRVTPAFVRMAASPGRRPPGGGLGTGPGVAPDVRRPGGGDRLAELIASAS